MYTVACVLAIVKILLMIRTANIELFIIKDYVIIYDVIIRIRVSITSVLFCIVNKIIRLVFCIDMLTLCYENPP